MKNTKKKNLRTKIIPLILGITLILLEIKKNFSMIKNTVFIDDGSPGNFNDFSIYSKSPDDKKYYPLLNEF